jgi:hypothetical protein
MDPDFRQFVAQHAYDIILSLIFVVKVLFFSKVDLKTKCIGLLILFTVIYFGQLLRTQMLTRGTSVLGYVALAIGFRLVALKMIFFVIDSEA